MSNTLTKREQFAANALTGITANPSFFGSLFQQKPIAAAEFAVECADTLIAELAKVHEQMHGDVPRVRGEGENKAVSADHITSIIVSHLDFTLDLGKVMAASREIVNEFSPDLASIASQAQGKSDVLLEVEREINGLDVIPSSRGGMVHKGNLLRMIRALKSATPTES